MSDRTGHVPLSRLGDSAGGHVVELVATHDWHATALGPRQEWPHTLRTVFDLMFASRLPMALIWGTDAILLYNDAFAAVLGTRHPQALGRPIRSIGKSNQLADQLHSWLESELPAAARTDISCTPIHGENQNVAGALAILTHTPREAGQALLRKMSHRMKNNLQLILSLISLQTSQVEDKRVLALFEATRNRVHAIATVHDMIDKFNGADIDIAAYAQQLAPELIRQYNCGQRIQVRVEGNAASLELERAVPFGLLLNELVSNACAHAFPGGAPGELSVRMEMKDDFNVVTVSDNGIGLAPALDYHRPASLGLRLVQMFAQQLRGEVSVLPGTGASIRLRYPASASTEE